MHYAKLSGVVFAQLVVLLAGALRMLSQERESPLAITEAGIQNAEDAPFVTPSYKFLPGEPVHFTFQVAGFRTTSAAEGQPRKLALQYTVTAEDAKGIALAPPASDTIEAELNPEDKDWTPKRRLSFQLPSFVAAGTYRITAKVNDSIGKAEISRQFPFHIGGVSLLPADSVSIQRFQFFRQENDREPLEVAAYQAGDAIFARFLIAGFKVGESNRYQLAYSATVLRPDGKPYLRNVAASELDAKSFYPASYVPGELNLTTSKDSAKGVYAVTVTVRDLIGNVSHDFKTSFSIE